MARGRLSGGVNACEQEKMARLLEVVTWPLAEDRRTAKESKRVSPGKWDTRTKP